MGKLYFVGFLFSWFKSAKIRTPRLIIMSQYLIYHVFMPYGNKAFEHDFVNVPEKEPIRIVYEIITIFLLDNFGVRVQSLR